MPDVPVPTLVYGTPGPVDVLALAAHPDDVELSCGGVVCKLVKQGHRVAIVDFTRGELGTRGTPETRIEESKAAAAVLGLTARENLGLPDGDLAGTDAHRRAVVGAIRRYRPYLLLVNAPDCRHPDHPAAARLAVEANFYAGLAKIETHEADGAAQPTHRAHHVLHYMQSVEFTPTLVVDVTDEWAQRTEAFYAFGTQFHRPDGRPAPGEAGDPDPATFIANQDFQSWIDGRARSYGFRVGATFGEPLLYRHGPFGTDDLLGVFAKRKRFA